MSRRHNPRSALSGTCGLRLNQADATLPTSAEAKAALLYVCTVMQTRAADYQSCLAGQLGHVTAVPLPFTLEDQIFESGR